MTRTRAEFVIYVELGVNFLEPKGLRERDGILALKIFKYAKLHARIHVYTIPALAILLDISKIDW